MSYKWCIKTDCKNNNKLTPHKYFVTLPLGESQRDLRNKWLTLAGRNPEEFSLKFGLFLCEDHFDMENDFTNYHHYKYGFDKRLYKRIGTMPSKLVPEEERAKHYADNLRDEPAQFEYKYIIEDDQADSTHTTPVKIITETCVEDKVEDPIKKTSSDPQTMRDEIHLETRAEETVEDFIKNTSPISCPQFEYWTRRPDSVSPAPYRLDAKKRILISKESMIQRENISADILRGTSVRSKISVIAGPGLQQKSLDLQKEFPAKGSTHSKKTKPNCDPNQHKNAGTNLVKTTYDKIENPSQNVRILPSYIIKPSKENNALIKTGSLTNSDYALNDHNYASDSQIVKKRKEAKGCIKNTNTEPDILVDGVSYPFKCKNCAKRFRHKGRLIQHLRKLHSGNVNTDSVDSMPTYICDYCGSNYCQKKNLVSHMTNKHAECLKKVKMVKKAKLFKCHQCENEYQRKQWLFIHILRKHAVNQKTDPKESERKVTFKFYCDKEISSKVNLPSHIQEHLRKLQPDSDTDSMPTFICDYCGIKYTRKKYLIDHIKSKHKTQNYKMSEIFKCDYCQKGYRLEKELTNHILSLNHILDHQESSDIEQKSSKIQQQFLDVQEKCENKQNCLKLNNSSVIDGNGHDKAFKCEKIYNHEGRLIQHLRKLRPDNHTDSVDSMPTFICDYCGAKYLHEKSLVAHLRKKHQVKMQKKAEILKCYYCQKQYLHKRCLESHIQKKHAVNKTTDNFAGESILKCQRNPFGCNHCYKRFYYKSRLIQHYRKLISDNEDTDSTIFICDCCGLKYYVRKSNLITHLRNRHTMKKVNKTEIVKCDFCQKEYRLETDLLNHIQTEHADQAQHGMTRLHIHKEHPDIQSVQQVSFDIQQDNSDLQQKCFDTQKKTLDIQQEFSDIQQKSQDSHQKNLDIQHDNSDLQQQCFDIQLKSPDIQQEFSDIQQISPDLQQEFSDIQHGYSDLQQECFHIQEKSQDTQYEHLNIQQGTLDIQQDSSDIQGGFQYMQDKPQNTQKESLDIQRKPLYLRQDTLDTQQINGNLNVVGEGNRNRKPFKCNHCNKMFLHQGRLLQHLRKQHSGSKDRYSAGSIPTFICDYCGLKYIRRGHLSTHMRNKHIAKISKKLKIWKCDYCQKEYQNKQKLYIHILRKHKELDSNKFEKELSFKWYCDNKISCKENVVSHIQEKHTDIQYVQLESLDMQEKSQAEADDPLNIEHASLNVKLLNKHEVSQDMQNKPLSIEQDSSNILTVSYRECPERQQRSLDLQQQSPAKASKLLIKRAPRIIPCYIVKPSKENNTVIKSGPVANSDYFLIDHDYAKDSQIVKKPIFVIPPVKKQKRSKGCIRNANTKVLDILVDGGNSVCEQFKCNNCGKRFRHQGRLIQHLRKLQSGNKDTDKAYGVPTFICEYCGSKYLSKRNLAAHIRNKHLVKKYKNAELVICHTESLECNYSDKSYYHKVRLIQHLRRLQPNNDKSDSADSMPKFICDYCQKEYSIKNHLIFHIQRDHAYNDCSSQRKSIIKCFCDKEFTSRVDLMNHIQKKHSLKLREPLNMQPTQSMQVDHLTTPDISSDIRQESPVFQDMQETYRVILDGSIDIQNESLDIQKESVDIDEEPIYILDESSDIEQESLDMQEEYLDMESEDIHDKPLYVLDESSDIEQESLDMQEEYLDMESEDINDEPIYILDESSDIEQESLDMQEEYLDMESEDIHDKPLYVLDESSDIEQESLDMQEEYLDMESEDIHDKPLYVLDESSDIEQESLDMQEEYLDMESEDIHDEPLYVLDESSDIEQESLDMQEEYLDMESEDIHDEPLYILDESSDIEQESLDMQEEYLDMESEDTDDEPIYILDESSDIEQESLDMQEEYLDMESEDIHDEPLYVLDESSDETLDVHEEEYIEKVSLDINPEIARHIIRRNLIDLSKLKLNKRDAEVNINTSNLLVEIQREYASKEGTSLQDTDRDLNIGELESEIRKESSDPIEDIELPYELQLELNLTHNLGPDLIRNTNVHEANITDVGIYLCPSETVTNFDPETVTIKKGSREIVDDLCNYLDIFNGNGITRQKNDNTCVNLEMITCKSCQMKFPSQVELLDHMHDLINKQVKLYADDAKKVLVYADNAKQAQNKTFLNTLELLVKHRVYEKLKKTKFSSEIVAETKIDDEEEDCGKPLDSNVFCRCCLKRLPINIWVVGRYDNICMECKRFEKRHVKRRKSIKAQLYACSKNKKLRKLLDKSGTCGNKPKSTNKYSLENVHRVFNKIVKETNPSQNNSEKNSSDDKIEVENENIEGTIVKDDDDLLKPFRVGEEKILVQPHDSKLYKSCLAPLKITVNTKQNKTLNIICDKCRPSETTNEKHRKPDENRRKSIDSEIISKYCCLICKSKFRYRVNLKNM